jgi:hypothetical protein
MIPYRIDEAELTISPEWHDQSLNVFKLPAAPNGKEASLVISRDIQRKSFDSFAKYADQQRKQLTEKLPGFKSLRDENIRYQEHDGLWLEYLWSNNGNTMHMWQVFYDRTQAALICTMTANEHDREHFETVWRKTMSAMKLNPVQPEDVPEPFPPPDSFLTQLIKPRNKK